MLYVLQILLYAEKNESKKKMKTIIQKTKNWFYNKHWWMKFVKKV